MGFKPISEPAPTLSLGALGCAQEGWQGACEMISHQLSWRGEGGVESLQAGPSLHQATEILGLFWGV